MSHMDIQLIKRVVFKTFHVYSHRPRTQNLRQVFWMIRESASLYDSDVQVFNRFPFKFVDHQTSLNMVAKRVSEISEDVEIIFPVNMIQAEHVPIPGGRAQRVVLNDEEARAALMSFVENSGITNKFLITSSPPEFNGDKKDFETWQQRFTWYIRNKSSVFARALSEWSSLDPGMSLFDLGNLIAHQTTHVSSGKTAISMGLELHGYLQAALQSCGLDRVLTPQAPSKGFPSHETSQ